MTQDNRPIMWPFRVALLVMIGACTRPNPKSCADGLCTDQALPFCDVDGALEGIPETCIAVDCAPMAFETCRGDQALVCNATGNDFDLVECPLGCSAALGGCQACATNDQCSEEAPVCDAGTCRGCAEDSECKSTICERGTGTCRSEASTLYVSAEATSGECTLSLPCTLTQAVTLAEMAALTPVIRLLPGTYLSPLLIDRPVDVKIVASGVDLRGLFNVRGGADIEITGIRVAPDVGEIACGDPARINTTEALSALTISDSVIGKLSSSRCTINVSSSEIALAKDEGRRLDLGDTSTLITDRVRFRSANVGTQASVVAVGGSTAITLRITNSVIHDVTFRFNATGLTTKYDFAFNTFHYSTNGLFRCQQGGSAMTLENNIISATSVPNAFEDGTACAVVTNNIFFPQAVPKAGNVVANPGFVDASTGDFQLSVGSPAIDAANPSAQLGTDHDFEGTLRPQGPKLDIGAFELKP